MKKVSALLTVMFLFTTMAFAQPSNTYRSTDKESDSTTVEQMKYNSWEASIFAGMQNYYGDLSNNNFSPDKYGIQPNWNVGLKVKYNYNRYFGFQGNLSFGKISSQLTDKTLAFKGSVFDFDIGGFINLTTLLIPKKYNKRLFWDINMNVGGNTYNSELFDINDVSLGKGDDMTMMIGIGTCIQYRLSNKIDLGIDIRLNSTGHDMLDLTSKGISNDAYGHLSLILGYTFGKQDETYKWNPMEDELKELWDAVNKNSDDIDSLNKRVSRLEAYHGKNAKKALPDDDNDGVPNEFDLSPDTPEGTMVNFQGIPIPVQDTALTQDNGSCETNTILVTVFFDYDRAIVNHSYYKKLLSAALFLKTHKDAKVQIVGNTDVRGMDEYNIKLSEKRCEAVKKILTEDFGIDSSRLETSAIGESKPISVKYNDVNRRVDVIIK